MSDITHESVHINRLLTDMSIGYRPPNMIADRVFPRVTVSKQTDNYAIIDKDTWLRRQETSRNPGEEPKASNFSVSSDTYNCRNYAQMTQVPYETQDNADNPINPLRDAVFYLNDLLAIDYEVRVRESLVSDVGTTFTVSSAWSDYTNSDVISDVQAARNAVYSTTGRDPNLAVIGRSAWNIVRQHPDVVNAVFPAGGGGGRASVQQFAEFLEVDEVLVGRTVYNTAGEGATGSYSEVWSTNLTLLHVDRNPGLMSTTFGLSFTWVGDKIGRTTPTNFQVMQEDLPKAGRTDLWTGYHQDEKVVAAELGVNIATGIT